VNVMTKPLLRSPFPPDTPSLQTKPPFRFLGTTTRVFPIKANMSRLRAFCDDYLNCGDNPFYRFQPAIPYVYVMILDYGKMAVVAENLGWIAQHEITFTIPLEWYEKVGGQWCFKAWAGVSPFIFVDNEISQTTGREVYGWPKIRAWFDPRPNTWTKHPRNPSRLMRLSTRVFPRVYQGERSEPGVLMEVWREPPFSYTQTPPALDGSSGILRLLPNLLGATVETLADGASLLARLPLSGYGESRDPRSLSDMFLTAIKTANLATGNPSFNQLTLKQFRDAHRPDYLCYQSIVNSVMAVDRFNGGGMLGDLAFLGGDTGGGLSIRMHRYTSQPIVDSLGLEAEDAGHDDKGIAVAKLRPSFPFWLDMDLNYGAGKTLCWRTIRSSWIKDAEEAPGTESSGSGSAGERPPNFYNTARGAATKTIPGPFVFPDVTVRVLPLMADYQRLQALCDSYLNDMHAMASEGDAGNHFDHVFKPFGSYVYLVIINRGDQLGTMSSESNDIGWWAEREVAFYIPVRWYRRSVNGHLNHVSFGVVAPFVFADNGQEVITDREINGRATTRAGIHSPSDAWMDDSGPIAKRNHLTLTTRLFPALNLGQRGEERTLLEIDNGDALAPQDLTRWREVEKYWGEALLRDHRQKIETRDRYRDAFHDSQVLARELLVNRKPFNAITLKQYRDVEMPDRACYQALVRTRKLIETVHELQEIQERIHVRIHRYQSLPVVDTLGLRVKYRDDGGDSAADVLQPLRPFWVRVSMREQLADNLCVRTGARDEDWEITDDRPMYFEEGGIVTDGSAPEAIDQPFAAATEASGKPTRLDREQARVSVDQIGEPHALIESLLSSGWRHLASKHPDFDGHCVDHVHKPQFCVRRDSVARPGQTEPWPSAVTDRVPGWYSEDPSPNS